MSFWRRVRRALGLVAALAVSLPAAAGFTVTDLAGRTAVFDKTPERIVVANYIANFLMVGGSGSISKIVAMTQDGWQSVRYGEYAVLTAAYPELRNKPSVGGYHDNILNSEKILALKPDVLLINTAQYADNSRRVEVFEKAGIRVIVLDYHAMKPEQHAQSTEILGRLLDRGDVAAKQIARYREVLDTIRSRIAALPEQQKNRRVYVETGSQGTETYGNSYNGTVLWGAILKNLSADNLAQAMRTPYASLDREYVLARDPQTIVITGSIWQNAHENDQMRMGLTVDEDTAQRRLARFAQRSGWSRLSAVKTGEVYAVDHGSLRCMLDYTFSMFLAKVLYPDTFADFAPESELAEFYRTYLPEVDAHGTFFIRLKAR